MQQVFVIGQYYGVPDWLVSVVAGVETLTEAAERSRRVRILFVLVLSEEMRRWKLHSLNFPSSIISSLKQIGIL